MSAPNIAALATVTGKSAHQAVTDSNVTFINNAAASDTLVKVNAIIVANVDGSNAADITVTVHNEDDIGGTGFAIASAISVPAGSSIVILGKDTPLYLEENMSIGVLASASGDLVAVASYEIIS